MPKIELPYFAACPNHTPAHEMLRRVLEVEGVAADVELVAVETEEEAKRQRFYGSPTVRIDGVDVVPHTHPTSRGYRRSPASHQLIVAP